jgi:hypothetical protein
MIKIYLQLTPKVIHRLSANLNFFDEKPHFLAQKDDHGNAFQPTFITRSVFSMVLALYYA